jgi:hypothetical protein
MFASHETSQEMPAECNTSGAFGLSFSRDSKFVAAFGVSHNSSLKFFSPYFLQEIYSRYFGNGDISYPRTYFINAGFYNWSFPVVIFITSTLFSVSSRTIHRTQAGNYEDQSR